MQKNGTIETTLKMVWSEIPKKWYNRKYRKNGTKKNNRKRIKMVEPEIPENRMI